MLTIYNTTVPVKDQAQADRLKQICIDYGLPVFGYKDAFVLDNAYFNFLYFHPKDGSFSIGFFKRESHVVVGHNKTIITESEWMELLTKTNNDGKTK